MIKKTFVIAIVSILIICVFSNFIPVEICIATEENTLYVGGTETGNYSSIQEAIDAANPGDTIFIYSGTYYENIAINKSIILIGDNNHTTIIEGSGAETVVKITGGSVNIHGFIVRNGGWSSIHFAGISIRSNDCIINKNIIDNNYHGIFLENTTQNIVSFNTISNNSYGIALKNSTSASIINNNIYENINDGIYLSNCSENSIINNTIANNQQYGIQATYAGSIDKQYRKESKNNFISKNLINNNKKDGIYLVLSNQNVVENNSIDNNSGHGILLHGSNNKIFGNIIRNNEYSGILITKKWYTYSNNNVVENNSIIENLESGINLDDATDSRIIGNEIKNNKRGISLSGTNNTIAKNNIEENSIIGLGIQPSSESNIIYHNNFINNIQNVYEYGDNIWDYDTNGNYWSDYTGTDADKDGIGDTPYDIYNPISEDNLDRYPLMDKYPLIKTYKSTTDGEKSTPGFELIIALCAIVLIAYLKQKRLVNH